MFTKYLSPLQTSTTSISHAFQRWLSLTASAVIFWTSVLICRWLTTDPTLSGILSFIFPILIIPILASIYAEVNYECSNVLKVICTFHSCNVPPILQFYMTWKFLYPNSKPYSSPTTSVYFQQKNG